MGEDSGDARHHHHADQEPGDEPQKGKGHHVEADVQVELGIGLAERYLVEEQQNLLPLTGGGASCKQAEQNRQAHHHDATDRFELGLVPVQIVTGLRVRGVHRPRAVGNPDGKINRESHDHKASQEDPDPGEVFCHKHFEEAELPVPEDVSPNICEKDEAHYDKRYDNQRGRQGPAS